MTIIPIESIETDREAWLEEILLAVRRELIDRDGDDAWLNLEAAARADALLGDKAKQ